MKNLGGYKFKVTVQLYEAEAGGRCLTVAKSVKSADNGAKTG